MRKFSSITLIALTVCVLALSFALPSLVAKAQDHIIGAQTDEREIRELQLTTTAPYRSMVELLGFRPQKYTTIILGDSIESEVSWEKYNLVMDALRFLESQGISSLDPEQFTVHWEQRFLVTSNNIEDSKLIWQIVLSSESRETVISAFLDDETGMLFAFNISGKNPLEETPRLWAEALSQYYGFSRGEVIQYERMRFTDVSGASVECSFRSSKYEFIFNSDALLVACDG